MNRDPIIEEVRRIRDAYARQFNYNLDAICADLKRREVEHRDRVVSLSPKRIKPSVDKRAAS